MIDGINRRKYDLNYLFFLHPNSIIAIFLPGSIFKLKLSKITFFVFLWGWMNLTFLNAILPLKSSLNGQIESCSLYFDNK